MYLTNIIYVNTNDIRFITSISEDEFDKKFINLKKERKLKLNKLNGSVR